jgi:acylphosphatase
LNRHELHYAGSVQGVGFRWTARALGARFAVTGFVRNLPDGRVHLVAEGSTEEVQKFLDAIHSEMGRYIAEVHKTIQPATGQFTSFEIRH